MSYFYSVQQFTQIYLLLRETFPFTKHIFVFHKVSYLYNIFFSFYFETIFVSNITTMHFKKLF